jgi:hypothetical protein
MSIVKNIRSSLSVKVQRAVERSIVSFSIGGIRGQRCLGEAISAAKRVRCSIISKQEISISLVRLCPIQVIGQGQSA